MVEKKINEQSIDDLIVDEREDTSQIRMGIIADTEVTMGLLLVGIGYRFGSFRNYMMVEQDTELSEIECFFHMLYKRPNIGIILLDYPTARRLGSTLDRCKNTLPVVVVLPTKASIIPYMDEKDRMRRQRQRDVYN